jgi:hypothetical protein
MRASFLAGLVLGLLVGVSLVLAGPGILERLVHWWAPVPAVALQPAVAVQTSTLRLTNTNNFRWKDIRFVLNAREPDDGYTFYIAHLPAGAQVEFTLTSFTTRDGHPFNPLTTKAFLLALEANTPQGRGVWSGRID